MYLFLALFASWIIWSARGEIFFIVAGILSCLLVAGIVRRMGIVDSKHVPLYFRWRTWRYTLWLCKEIIVSAITVVRIVLRPELSLSPKLDTIIASQQTEEGIATYATSITMTPGTVSVGVRKGALLVHALDKSMYHTLTEEKMNRKVTREVEA